MPDRRWSTAYRGAAVAGVGGGALALAVFIGVMGEEDRGDLGMLVLAVVLLAIGIPALIAWLKTL